MVTLARTEEINNHGQTYLNRLSDLLFVASRVLARDEGGSEVLWRNKRDRRRLADGKETSSGKEQKQTPTI
jgi:cob(I)alamin adenosyltransferase